MVPDFLFSPLTYAIMIALPLALVRHRLPRALQYVGLIIELLLLVSMAPLGANQLVHAIESRVPPVQSCTAPTPDTIVLLSGGVDRPARRPDDYAALTLSSLRRLFAAVALWRNTAGARLVIAGGDQHGVPESVVLASMAQRLGVPAAAIRAEQRSLTTWQNAQYLSRESPRLPQRIWLVSSALHLPRALGAFRAFGFRPCAWPSGSLYIPPPGGIGYYVPQSSSLVKAEMAIHEWVGGWVYAWRARHVVGTTMKLPLESADKVGRRSP
jgi:uncharacterized SAM-binding protein YcdF (DUF218 family)